MLEPPDFPHERIDALLCQHYGLAASEIAFLPLGFDYAASVYRVAAASGVYFLKLTKRAIDPAALRVPHWLRAHDIEQVVAPLPTLTDALCVAAGEYALILYPFVDGLNAMERPLTEAQWLEFGAALRRIHATALTPEMTQLVTRETFDAHSAREQIRALLALAERDDLDEIAAEMAVVWREQRDTLTRLVDRAEALAAQMRTRSVDFVLCHTDIHIGNVLARDDGHISMVDWDQPLTAPKERDLMFIVGSAGAVAVSPENQALFLRGYGETEIDPVAFAYYRYDWVVQDAMEYGAMGFGLREGSDHTRRDAILWMRRILSPNDALGAADRAAI